MRILSLFAGVAAAASIVAHSEPTGPVLIGAAVAGVLVAWAARRILSVITGGR